MVAEEAIMICIDNSRWMHYFDNRYSFKLQLTCVRLYCRTKLKSNPKNAIGIMTLSSEGRRNLLEPTSDLDKILGHLKYVCDGERCKLVRGDLDFFERLDTCRVILEEKYPSNPKRMIFFTGGPTNISLKTDGKEIGEDLKERGIAVDIVNFCLNENYGYCWIPGLEELVAAADNNNNSHIKHLQPSIWTLACDVLSSMITFGACSLEEEEKRALMANNPPNTNDDYEDYALARTVKLKNEYMASGNEDAANHFAELEKSVLEERQLERAKYNPRELLLLHHHLEEEPNPQLELAALEENKSQRKRNRKRDRKRKPLEVADNNNNNILKAPPPGVTIKSCETREDYEDDNPGLMPTSPAHGCSRNATPSPQRSRSYVNVNYTNLSTTPRELVKSLQVSNEDFPYNGSKLPPSQQLVKANLKSQIPSVAYGIVILLIVVVSFFVCTMKDVTNYNLVPTWFCSIRID